MLNILHAKIAFVDWVRDEETYLNLEVNDTLDLKATHFGYCTWRTLWET